MSTDKKRFVLIDSNSLIHRAYHAYPSSLSTSKGLQTNAVYGFVSILLSVIEKLEPEYIISVFDTRKPTVRHKKYKEYKATRKPTDQELIDQIPIIKKVLKAFNVPTLQVDGYEADDIIGTLESHEKMKDYEKVIVSGDHDLLQLVDQDTKVYLSGRSVRDSKMINKKGVVEKLKVKPEQVVDYKALRGDSSDNIPGVKGIGKKGAEKLLKRFVDLDGIYENLEKISTRYKNRLKENKKNAYLSKDLATIIKDVDIDYEIEQCRWDNLDLEKVKRIFKQLEFRSLMKKVKSFFSSEKRVVLDEDFKLGNLKTIQISKDEIPHFAKDLKKQDRIVLHSKTRKESCLDVEPDKLYIAWEKYKVFIIDFKDFCEDKDLRKIIEDEKVEKVSYSFKALCHSFRNESIYLKGKYIDIKLIAFLVRYGGKTDLKDLAFSILGFSLKSSKEEQMKIISDENETNSIETAIVFQLGKYFEEKIQTFKDGSDWNLYKLYYNIELPFLDILVKMERNGLLIDKTFLKDFAKDLDERLEKIEEKIYSCIGHEFNINSPSQVGEVLFEELGLPKPKRTKSGKFSTGVKVLEGISDEHEVVKHILEYRKIAKLRSTYTTSLIDAVEDDGRIHSTFSQTVASTGRIASSDPNVQNIPISTKLGRKIRKGFIAPNKAKLISFDYSQQELRILAHLSEDDSLIEAFRKDVDIHKLTASKLFDKSVEDIDAKERSIGKTINFGVIYGMSAYGLSSSQDLSYDQAEEFIEKYFKQYGKIKKFFRKYLEVAKDKGFVKNMFGRRRSAKGLSASNVGYREAVVREIKNFPIQSAAADMMKLGMLKAEKVICEKFQNEANLVLQVHDEINFEYLGNEMVNFKKEVKKALQEAVKLKVPLKVDCRVGSTLEEIH